MSFNLTVTWVYALIDISNIKEYLFQSLFLSQIRDTELNLLELTHSEPHDYLLPTMNFNYLYLIYLLPLDGSECCSEVIHFVTGESYTRKYKEE